ncbi:hypothetical protein P7C71_g2159, partial [Lecanoromycetidae sp. Uapishka_2]
MNRFRSRKKSDGWQSAGTSRRPSIDRDDVPAMPSMPSFASKTFRRKKQASPPPKPEVVDIATALPSSDEFRTSLLMPNLSARFSMLREQDDPTSKIGKANDDSVLFPKRASRLDLFNRKGLSDIAEVDSLRGSIRPPFTQSRTESYGSGGYDTDDGSVMSRSRPGEGNTMFGGRQKIYKIPVGGSGSVKNFNAEDGDLPTGGNMGGKALYEEDTAPSAFQKLREQERQQERQERERGGPDQLRSSHDQDRSGSPPLAKYDRNRETTSSTNSGPSHPRTSTAATSVASQRSAFETINGTPLTQPSSAGSDRPGPKGRRMYGQGLDQHMHEQQSSALHRLASLQTQRGTAAGSGTPRDLIQSRRQSRSASNLNDRYQRAGPLYASNGFRAASPAPSGTPPRMQDFDLGLNDEASSNNIANSGYERSPPLSPPMSPTKDLNGSDPLVASLEPNDLGKATASGAFNKPKVMYNEQQYLQRQLQLQEGRGTPSPQLIRPFSPQALSIDEQTTGRSRNNSFGSQFSRTNSSRQPWEHHMEDRILRPVHERGSGTNSPSIRENEDRNDHSFFAGISGSETGSQRENESEPNSPIPSTTKSHGFSQPTLPQTKPVELKQQLNFNPNPNLLSEPAEDASDSRSYRSETTITQHQTGPLTEQNKVVSTDADSPTLGPVEVSNGLSGLVREHLRKQSDQSSIYPEDSPTMNRFPDVRQSIFGHESALQSHSRNQSHDEAEADRQYWARQHRESDQSSVMAPPPLSFAARHILEQATALRNNHDNAKAQQMLGNDKAQRILGGEAPRANSSHARNNSAAWQEPMKAHHSRGASTETQKEREDLANELAERRRMVQDNLRTYTESNSRSVSPAPGASLQDSTPPKSHPFGILKKNSKTSLVGPQQQQERPSKAMKMLGIGPSNGPGPMPKTSQPQPPPDMFVGREQFSDRAMPPKQKFPPQPLTQPRRPQDVRQHSDTPQSSFSKQFEPTGVVRNQENFGHQKHSPRSSKSGSAGSDMVDRRSPEARKVNGNGSTKPSMEQGIVNGFIPNGAAAIPRSETNKNIPAPRPTNELIASLNGHASPAAERSQSAMSGRLRSRSNSRTTAKPGYFEPRVAPPNAPFMINPAGRPSNAHPYPHSASSTPSINDSRPSFTSQASSTPAMGPPHSAPSSSHGHSRHGHGGRKRSVNKHEISEPTFVSCTSSVDTVDLPPEASLRNGMDSPPSPAKVAPPIPARDSRRKRTQTLLQALGRIQSPEPSPAKRDYPPSPYDESGEVQSTFSADDDDEPDSRMMRRLRKTSSEGGNMNKLAKEKILQSQSQVPSPAVPNFSFGAREMQKSPTVTGKQDAMGDHFPYQARQDVPASAVMF